MTERRQASKTSWISIVVTIAIAVAGWTFVLVENLGAANRNVINQGISNEKEARIVADKTITDSLDKVIENTKDIPALVAEMKIVLGKLGLDGKP